MAEPIRLLVVESPTLVRRCLAALLNRRRGLRVLGEAASGPEAVALTQTLLPDVVVVEPGVPDGGHQLVAALCRAVPGCAVLVLTLGGGAARGERAASRMLQAGARGYLEKDCEPDALVRAVERVRAGELVVAPAATDAVLEELGTGLAPGRGPKGRDGLTGRELEVVELIVRGRTNPEIARALSITEHTVKGHVTKILRKLGFENRVQLTAYATQRGLAPSSPPDGSAPAAAR